MGKIVRYSKSIVSVEVLNYLIAVLSFPVTRFNAPLLFTGTFPITKINLLFDFECPFILLRYCKSFPL